MKSTEMKLSDFSLSVLKNFATINEGMVLQPGKTQSTVASDKSIFVEVNLEEQFPHEFGIYDLNQFIGNISTMGDTILDFDSEYVTLSDGTILLKYYASKPALIRTPPKDKKIDLPKPDVSFDLDNASLSKLLKLANMNTLPHLTIEGKKGIISVKTHDKTNDTSNIVGYTIGKFTGEDFTATFKTESLKFIPDDYSVGIKTDAFARFVGKNHPIKYFVSMDMK